MGDWRWRLEDLAWDTLATERVDPELVPLIKAAALVEVNAEDYTAYLCQVFADDPAFQAEAIAWAVEEVRHGQALGRWAERVDPGFRLEAAAARFRAGFRLPTGGAGSVRGSRSGELIARCMVEIATSSYYTVIADTTGEPLLRSICRKIAADELRHYKLFLAYARVYQKREGLGWLGRIKVAVARVGETEDDELAYAYYAANAPPEAVYDRGVWARAYARRVYPRYRAHHVARAAAMAFKACGLDPRGAVCRWTGWLAWRLLARRGERLRRLEK